LTILTVDSVAQTTQRRSVARGVPRRDSAERAAIILWLFGMNGNER